MISSLLSQLLSLSVRTAKVYLYVQIVEFLARCSDCEGCRNMVDPDITLGRELAGQYLVEITIRFKNAEANL